MASSSSNVTWDASYYAKYRPSYSTNVFEAIFEFMNLNVNQDLLPIQGTVVDVGCGSGQVTLILPRYFDTVIGIDPSETQLEAARQRATTTTNTTNNTPTFICAPSEHTTLPSASADLVTAASALHWFDIKSFYLECRRILKPTTGTFAAWSYYKQATFHVNGKESKRAQEIYINLQNIFKSYFDAKLTPLLTTDDGKEDDDRRHRMLLPVQGVDFHCVKTTAVDMVWPASVDIISGWVKSWSGFPPYVEKNGKESAEQMMEQFEKDMMDALGVSTRDDAVDIVMVIDIILAKDAIPPLASE